MVECAAKTPSPAELTAELPLRAMALGLWGEQRGFPAPVPLATSPLRIEAADWLHLQELSRQVWLALRQLPRLRSLDARTRELLPYLPEERLWLDSTPPAAEPWLFCRLDGVGDLADLKLVESNFVGVGGLTYAPATQQAVQEVVGPWLPGRVQAPADPRQLLLEALAARLPSAGPRRLALVDDLQVYTLGGEMGRLAPYFRARGVETVVVDPRELECGPGGKLLARGQPVDLVYRFLELGELAAIEAAGADLSALRAGFRQGRVVPGLDGDLDLKSTFEILTSPEFEACFSPRQLALFHRHVLWTRLLRERRTTDPQGREVDLVPFARGHRHDLVLKPNRAFGGVGVVLGHEVSQRDWEEALHRALSQPGSHVVQQSCAPSPQPIAVAGADGHLDWTPRHVSAGLFPGLSGTGFFGRYASKAVVNLHQGGGVAALLIG